MGVFLQQDPHVGCQRTAAPGEPRDHGVRHHSALGAQQNHVGMMKAPETKASRGLIRATARARFCGPEIMSAKAPVRFSDVCGAARARQGLGSMGPDGGSCLRRGHQFSRPLAF